ncbi:MAG: PKD domain-containing protein, partial [Thiohalomonadales bacterium]
MTLTPTIANPSVTYTTAGTYSVSLTVTDSLGLASTTSSIMVTVTDPVVNQMPIAVIVPPTTPIETGAAVTFTGDTSNDPDGNTPLTYNWQIQTSGMTLTPTIANPSVTYTTAGSYSVGLTVTDSLGLASTTTSIMVTVTDPAVNQMPIAVIMPDVTQNIVVGDSVNFTGDTSSDPDSTAALSYAWTFPTGAPTGFTQANPGLVNFNTVGTHTVTLVVTDSLGLASAMTSVDVVVSAPIPVAVIAPPAGPISTGVAVTFIGSNSTNPSATTTLSYAWQFQTSGMPVTSILVDPVVTYTTVGTYSVSLTVTDNLGVASLAVSTSVTVTDPAPPVNQAPIGNIQTTPTVDLNNTININVGDIINYSGTATDVNGDSMTFDWALAGGTPATSILLTPGDVSYSMAGTYTTTFTVTDLPGLASTPATLTVVVSAPAPAGTVVSMIVLNDLHAHLIPHDDIKRNVDGTTVAVKRGGLARIATEINMIRANNPNNLLLNIGDTYHGGVEAFYSLGNAIVAPVEALGIDVGVPGNWDFAFGPNVTRNRFTGSNLPTPGNTIIGPDLTTTTYLAANVTLNAAGTTLLPATVTLPIAGINIGIIGLTSDIVPTMHPSLALGMTFLTAEADYIALIEQLAADLRAQVPPADVVLVMSELGIHKDKRLADTIAMGTVDVFFSAHTHELTSTPLTSTSGALVVEAGNDTYLGRMDITVAAAGNSFNWRIIPIEATIVEDATMKALVDTARAPYLAAAVNMSYPMPIISAQTLTMPINTVLTTTTRLLSRRHSLESSFNNLMTDMLIAVNGTQLALTPGFRFDATIPGAGDLYEDQTVATGNITLEDVYRFFPVPYNLATANITGQALRDNIETNLSKVYSNNSFSQSGGWFDGYAGLNLSVALTNADAARITAIDYKASNTPVGLQDVITITGCTRPFELNSTAFCTNDINFTSVTTLLNPAGNPVTPIDFFAMELQAGSNAGLAARQDITDSSATPLWPISEFIQPINGLP